MLNTDETIGAIASPAGGALRGILRISGPEVVACLERCFVPARGSLQEVTSARLLSGLLQLPMPIGDLECDLYLWPTERSFTRQPVAELHTFGNLPLLDAALQTLCAAGVRLAEPGEFTLRAFLAGRIDLTQAEAVLGVIDARTNRELQTALSQMAGDLANPLNELRKRLLELLADLEAGLDFVEEEIEFVSTSDLRSSIRTAERHLTSLAERLDARGNRAVAPRVVLVGSPNVGKSSLFNALARLNRALVSEQAGTTRDYLLCLAHFAGREVMLVDTAGRETDPTHAIDVASQSRRSDQAAEADLRVLCLDTTRPLNAWERDQLGERGPSRPLIVRTKIDITPSVLLQGAPDPQRGIGTSAVTGAGIDELRQAITGRLAEIPGRETLGVIGTASRCRESLRRTGESLRRAYELATNQMGEELIAAEIRHSLEELGRIVGAFYTDELLDSIFSRFCIGK